MKASTRQLPVVIDPFSRTGDEVAGETPDEIALNLGRALSFNRAGALLQHEPPNLRQLFKGCALSEPAKEALRKADAAFSDAARRAGR
jgi:hypothetical protein